MKIQEIIQEFIPCEVCGNKDINNFYFHVFAHWGSQPYVKCCECEEEYYSTKARAAITKMQDSRRSKLQSGSEKQSEAQKGTHPLLKLLSKF